MSESLYFIAILPSSEIREMITHIKKEIAEKFGSKQSLKSPPHITLHMPFRWKDAKENQLLNMISKLNESIEPFEVKLEGFGFFEPRVIYIDVEENEPLRQLQQSVVQSCRRDLKLLNSNYKDQVFRPHLTVAFRDLKKAAFFEAKAYYSDRSFSAHFKVTEVELLRHDGKKWEILSLNP